MKILLILLLIPFFAFSETVDSNITELNVIDETAEYLKSWKLTKKEYERYLYIKNNTPRGYYTPRAHPLFYLGLEARTEQERDRYAKMIAELEYENFEKIQAFSKLIQEHQFKMYAHEGVMDIAPRNKPKSNQIGFVSVLYVDVACIDACKNLYEEELSKVYQGETKQLQIVFPRGSSAEQLNLWANRMQIPVELNSRDVLVLRYQRDDENINQYPLVKTELL